MAINFAGNNHVPISAAQDDGNAVILDCPPELAHLKRRVTRLTVTSELDAVVTFSLRSATGTVRPITGPLSLPYELVGQSPDNPVFELVPGDELLMQVSGNPVGGYLSWSF